MDTKPKQRPGKAITMWLPLDVYERVTDAAKRETRSVSTQIVHILKQEYQKSENGK